MKRIKTCFVITRMIQGGAQKVVLDLIEGLDPDAYDVTLVHGSFDEDEGTLLPRADQLGVRRVCIPALRRPVSPWHDVVAVWRLYRFFRAERFHLVHVHTSKAGLLGALAARLAKMYGVVYSPHGHIFYRAAAIRGVSENSVKLVFFYWLRRLAERLAHRVIALTAEDKAEQVALGLAPAAKYVVISNGVDPSRFSSVGDCSRLRRRLGLGNAFPVIGTVGRLSGEKGQEHLVDALPKILEHFPQAKLLLVGDGPAREALTARVAQSGLEDHVVFCGMRGDVPQLLSIMDVFVLPSLYEAQGIATVEAMAAGVPVVATAVGGVPGIVEDGRNGLLVPPCHAGALSAAVLTIARNPEYADALAGRARQTVQDRLTLCAMVAAHDRLYRWLLAGHAVGKSGPRVLVLSPADHFHAPIVLRDLCAGLPNTRISVLLTPRLGPHKGRALRTVLRQSGWDFLLSMAATKVRVELLRLAERLMGVAFASRHFLCMAEVVRRYSLPARFFADANSPEAVAYAESVRPDVVVLNLFNQIAGERLISVAGRECINIHTSPLPAYRGVAPNFWALANGERVSGVSLHRVAVAIDAGEILAQESVPIDPRDSFFSLYRRCSAVGARLLVQLLQDVPGRTTALRQDGDRASYFSFVTRDGMRRFRARRRAVFSLSCLAESAWLLKAPDAVPRSRGHHAT